MTETRTQGITGMKTGFPEGANRIFVQKLSSVFTAEMEVWNDIFKSDKGLDTYF